MCGKNKRISRKDGRYRLVELHLDRNVVIKLILNGVRIQLMLNGVQWRAHGNRNELGTITKAGLA